MKTSNAEEHEARDKVPLMEEILHQLILVGRLSHYLQGFYTSQVVQDFFHQQYVMTHDCWPQQTVVGNLWHGNRRGVADWCDRATFQIDVSNKGLKIDLSPLITLNVLVIICNCITYLHIFSRISYMRYVHQKGHHFHLPGQQKLRKNWGAGSPLPVRSRSWQGLKKAAACWNFNQSQVIRVETCQKSQWFKTKTGMVEVC